MKANPKTHNTGCQAGSGEQNALPRRQLKTGQSLFDQKHHTTKLTKYRGLFRQPDDTIVCVLLFILAVTYLPLCQNKHACYKVYSGEGRFEVAEAWGNSDGGFNIQYKVTCAYSNPGVKIRLQIQSVKR